MALIKILDLIVKGFEEFVYMVTYFVLCASRLMWSYRWLIGLAIFFGVLCIGGLIHYLNITNGGLTWN